LGAGKSVSVCSQTPNIEIEVMSQCSRDVSIPNVVIACAPMDPMIRSSSGAIASSARPIRSSLSTAGSMSNTSSTVQALAQSVTWTSGVGEVSRLAINAWMTCPWDRIATSRTGQARSMIPARSKRQEKSAMTGNAPNVFSILAATYRAWRRPR
jgi:hypothetical protein